MLWGGCILVGHVPMGWRQVASVLLRLTEELRVILVPLVEVVSAMIVARLGLRWVVGPPVALTDLSVKADTAMQLVPVVAARQLAHARFVQEPLGITEH